MLYSLSVSPEGELKPLSSIPSGTFLSSSSFSPFAHLPPLTGGLWPCHSSLLPSSSPSTLPRFLTTNYKGASLSSVSILPSGAFSSPQLLSYADKGTPGPHPDRQLQSHPHGAHVDPRGLVVVVPDLGTDELRIVGIDPATGKLEDVEDGTVKLQPGDGPRHVVFSRTGERLYVLNELSNSISVFSVDYPSPTAPPSSPSSTPPHSLYPTFTLLQSRVSLLPPSPFPHQSSSGGFASWHAAELLLTPCGRFLFASNRAEGHDPLNGTRDGEEDLLAVFAVGEDGTLEEGGRRLVGSGGRAPRHMSLSRTGEGKYLAVALHDSDEVVVFEREGGKLKEVARKRDVGRPGVVIWG